MFYISTKNVMLFVIRFNENHSKSYTDCLSVWIREVLSFSLQQLLRIGGKIMSLWTSFCQFNASYVRIKETLPCLLSTKKWKLFFSETQPQWNKKKKVRDVHSWRIFGIIRRDFSLILESTTHPKIDTTLFKLQKWSAQSWYWMQIA